MSGVKHQESLVNSLKARRAEHGWTQAELGFKVGVSRKTINTIENGVFVPSTILAIKLAQLMGLAVEELFQLSE